MSWSLRMIPEHLLDSIMRGHDARNRSRLLPLYQLRHFHTHANPRSSTSHWVRPLELNRSSVVAEGKTERDASEFSATPSPN